MSSTKASSAERRFTTRPFFAFTLRQNKHQFALYVIIVLLAMLLPCIISLGEGADDLERQRTVAELAMLSVGARGIFVSGVIALFAGMGTLSYVNSKQATGCYHSLPVRREWMFLTETAVRSIYYIIAIVFGYGAGYFMLLGSLKYAFEFTGIYLQYALCAVILFMYIYSIVLLAAGLTGTAFMRFAMTAVITFLPFILYLLVLSTFWYGNTDIDSSYHMGLQNLKNSFSFIRVINALNEVVEKESVWRMLLVIPESLLYYGIALVLHKYRRSEQASNTVVWKPLFAVIKYVLIVSAALLGMVFGLLFVGSGGTAYLFLGTIVGLVFSFMLVNSILYRSPRLMFKGVKPFIAVSAVMLLYVIFVPMNVTGLVGKAYPAWNTSSVTFIVNGEEVEIRDRDSIKTIVPNLKERDEIEGNVPSFCGISEKKSSAEVVEKYSGVLCNYDDLYEMGAFDAVYTDEGMEPKYRLYAEYFTVIQKPRFGFTLARSYVIQTNSEIWDIVTKTEDYAEAYTLSNILDDDREIEGIHIDFRFYDVEWHDYNKSDKSFIKKQIPKLLEICELKTEYRENSPLVAVLELYTDKDDWDSLADNVVYYPVYAADFEALEYVNSLLITLGENLIEKYKFEDAESYYRIISKKYIDPVLLDTLTGEARPLTNAQLAELAPHTASFGFNYNLVSVSSRYGSNEWIDVSTSRYMIIAKEYNDDNKYGHEILEIRFRDGAISDAELEAFFNGLEE